VARPKEEIRADMQKRLGALSKAVFSQKGTEAAARLWTRDEWKTYASVLLFLSTEYEISTQSLLELAFIDRKQVFAPRIDGAQLCFYRVPSPRGPWTEGTPGIREPPREVPLAMEHFPALVVTPGLAFDRHGRRLGRGKGFYDRFLAGLDAGVLSGAPAAGGPAENRPGYFVCGMCLEIQLVDEVPAESRDRPVNGILTEKRFLLCG
jgi:5-formyltetrahydrofolate cyclo-ligase